MILLIVRLLLVYHPLSLNFLSNVLTVEVEVYSRSCEIWRLKKHSLPPSTEDGRSRVEDHNLFSSSPDKKRGNMRQIVKKIIRLKPCDWESFIKEIKASLEHSKKPFQRCNATFHQTGISF